MNAKRKQGSALLVTLLVTSLLVALVLAFSATVRLELRQVQTRVDTLKAQQHARLALELAIGQLQELAGVDERSTARADILGAGVQASSRYWTGVWTRNPDGSVGNQPVWLVSGVNPNPGSAPPNPNFRIVSTGTATEEVRIPLANINNPQNQLQGQMGYWVSDEASKASLLSRRHHHTLYQDPLLQGGRRRIEYVNDFGVNLGAFFSNAGTNLLNNLLNTDLGKAPSRRSLALANVTAGNTLEPRQNLDVFHHATPQSFGVLENPADGGLKRNLADLSFRDTFLATEDTAKFLGPKNGVLTVESGLPSARGILPGQPFFSPRPLLTEAVLYVGLFHSRTANDGFVRIRYHMESEFLNPYSLPLQFPPDPAGTRGLVMIFENLPTLRITDESGTGPSLFDNLSALSYRPTTDRLHTINSWFDILPFNSTTPRIKPGEIYQVMEPNPATQAEGLARNIDETVRWRASLGTLPPNDAMIRIEAVHPPGGVRIRGVPFDEPNRNLNPGNRPDIFSYSGLNFNDFTYRIPYNQGPNPFSRERSTDYKISDYTFAYHFRLYSDETDLSSLRDILSGANILDPDFNSNLVFVDLNGANRTHSEILDPISKDPTDIVSDTINLFSKLDVFMDQTARSHNEDYRKMILVDVPDGDAISIGQLTHLPLYRLPLWTIGSPGGGELNKAFDRYYLSPKLTHSGTGEPLLRNPSLSPLTFPSANAIHTDAVNEMVDGAFNLNSTSADSWFSILSAPILSPAAQDEAAAGERTRFSSFFRHPRHQAIETAFSVSSDELQNPSAAFSQGIRSLDDGGSQTRIRQMAQRIVTALRTRGQPFPDLQSFINSGILQAAIDADPSINQGLFDHSNVYLLQQDLLTKIAPALQPRSDTFLIRAYGSVQSTATGTPSSRAVCEALVQRLPEKVDGSDPMTPADGITNHRMFRILSFRWLTDEEI